MEADEQGKGFLTFSDLIATLTTVHELELVDRSWQMESLKKSRRSLGHIDIPSSGNASYEASPMFEFSSPALTARASSRGEDELNNFTLI